MEQHEKEEHLRIAKATYPIGTKYYNATYRQAPENIKIIKGELKFHNSTSSPNGHITDGCGGAVFYQGVWATKIEERKTRIFKMKFSFLTNKNKQNGDK